MFGLWHCGLELSCRDLIWANFYKNARKSSQWVPVRHILLDLYTDLHRQHLKFKLCPTTYTSMLTKNKRLATLGHKFKIKGKGMTDYRCGGGESLL